MVDDDWQRLFGSEPYLRLRQREAEMGGPFEDADFRQFVLSEALLARSAELARTFAAWMRIDMEAAARAALAYLPAQARIHARVFPVIKPQSNSFVFGGSTDPTIFLYVDSTRSAERFENTLRHELHHIGYESAAWMDDPLGDLPAGAGTATGWMGAFGEGMAMLAAAGGPDVHPHAHSSPEDRARWDRDMANLDDDLRSVERFFLDIIDGRLAGDDQVRAQAMTFFGVQGPWYTVGWKMSALVEERFGRETLIECMLEPRRLLATYNRAVTAANSGAPLWSARLLQEVRATPASAAAPDSAA